MKKRKIVIPANYLDRIPSRPATQRWRTEDDDLVTLEVDNTGWVNRIAQALFGRPKVSYIHLDTLGSFIWQVADGDKTITDIGRLVDEKFGEEAHPLYERLARYFQILDSYRFITWMGEEK